MPTNDSVSHLDDFAPLPDLPQFDEHGLMVGDGASELWREVLLSLEARVDLDGWDRPAKLYGVVGPAYTEAVLGQPISFADIHAVGDQVEGDDGGRDDGGSGGLGEVRSAMSVIELVEVDGHPIEALWGYQAPPFVAGVIATFEGWAVDARKESPAGATPAHSRVRPSQHPDRVEVRSLVLVTRAGHVHAIARHRGSDPEPTPANADGTSGLEGFLVDVLRRTVGAPTGHDGYTVGDYLGRVALRFAVQALGQIVNAQVDSREPLPLAEGAESLVVLRAELDELPERDRQEVLRALALRHLLAAVARVTWLATGKGKKGLPTKVGRLLHEAAMGRRVDIAGKDLLTLIECARVAGNLTWDELAKVSSASEILPVQARNSQWAGADLVARWCCERVTGPQEDELAELEALTDTHTARSAQLLLQECCWNPSGPAREE